MILGAKVRAVVQGRAHVATEDLQQLALPALTHRVTLNFAAHADGVTAADIVKEIAAAGLD